MNGYINVFMHIPSTGGKTLIHYLDLACKEQNRPFIWYSGLAKITQNLENIIKYEENPIVFSHAAFGITAKLDIRYHTILRNPLDRAISEWIYVGTESKHHLSKQARSMKLIDFFNTNKQIPYK